MKTAKVRILAICALGIMALAARADGPTAAEKAAAELDRFAGGPGIEFVVVMLDRGRDILPKKAVAALASAKSDEAFVLAGARSEKGSLRVYVAGKTSCALSSAVTAFLEDYCGVRFFHAGPGGTVIPEDVRCSATEALFDVREPCISYRRLMFNRASVEPNVSLDDFKAWMVRRGYQIAPAESSTQAAFGGVVPLSLFETHPEYFPLIDGTRSLEVARRLQRRCLTNPDVLRLVSDFIVTHCRHDNAFLLSQYTEVGGWCECESCRAAGRGDDGRWRVQNYVHRFGAELSRRALVQFPEARICAQAYRDWRQPPTAADIVYDPRVAVHYCPIGRCYAHPLSAGCNEPFRHDYEKWRQHAPRLGTFGWSSVSGMRYSPMARVFAKDFSWLLNQGFDAWLDGCSTSVEHLSTVLGNWRLYYVASRMMWNPDLDVEVLLDETDRLYYGRAYAPMHAYQLLRQKVWDATEGHATTGAPGRYRDCLAQPGAEEELLRLLAAAEKLAAGDAELLARLAIDRRGLEQYWIAGHREKQRQLAARRSLPREEREIYYRRVKETVVGWPAEEIWAKAPCRAFYVKGRQAPTEGTEVRLVADDTNWFVRFAATYDGEPVCKADGHDGTVWLDDAVELFARSGQGEFCQIVVNAKGVLYDALGKNGVEYDYGGDVRQAWRGKTLITDLRLPAASVAGEGKGTDGAWSFLFSRDNPHKNEWSGLGDEWRDAVPAGAAGD